MHVVAKSAGSRAFLDCEFVSLGAVALVGAQEATRLRIYRGLYGCCQDRKVGHARLSWQRDGGGVSYREAKCVEHRSEHTRANPQKNIKGGIVTKESPVQVSNLMVICTECGKPTRVGHKFLEDGSKVRTCRKCDGILDRAKS